ncbi:AAA family ATPase [Gudongella sp. DL1XJH-153]|uniref:AAA family ATPase n=1 Tax=Gudongella sp. DL1XJH-153 TaxID=3409804 RepID=UPI003BB6A32E
MSKIEFYLLGSPRIQENGQDIYIPMGKVSGILFYLLIRQHSNRDELVSMFWPSSNEDKAKTSLRNALHKIRKAFSQDLLLTPNKSSIIINQSLDVFVDALEFESKTKENNHLYADDFLKGFNIKDSIDFEDWLLETRNYYKNKFVVSTEKTIMDKYDNNELKDLENDIYRLLSADSYNEVGYLYLLRKYEAYGRYDKVINEYHKYKNLLRDELGVVPSEKIETIYKKSTKKLKDSSPGRKQSQADFLYYREFELSTIQENLNSFKNSQAYKSILVTGEYGIGKTVLINKLLKNNEQDFNVFKIQCSSVERNFTYAPWIELMKEVDEVISGNNNSKPKFWSDVTNYFFYDGNKNFHPSVQIFELQEKANRNVLHNAFLKAFEMLNNNKKTIIVIEDIQWFDRLSLELLNNLIMHINKNTLFILSMTQETKNIGSLFTPLIDLNKLMHVMLRLFDKKEAETIIKRSIDRAVPEKDIDYIYQISKGNAFFLKEYIDLYKNNKDENFLVQKINNVLYEKFQSLSSLEDNILSILSVYRDQMSIDFLTAALNEKAFEVLKSINNLVQGKIIDEIKSDDQIYIKFSYVAYQEYIYDSLNDSSKQILHREIAEALESDLLHTSVNINSYIKLRDHFSKSNAVVKTLKYEVYILNYYLNFNHELFPNIINIESKNSYHLNNEKALKWINDIETEILKVKNTCNTKKNEKEVQEIELMFLYCKGRYLIRYGNYAEGTKVIRRVINYANEIDEEYVELLGHKQMVIYGIQINDTNVMLNHIVPGIKVAKKLKNNEEQGILFRLYGLYYIIKGDFESAEKLLRISLDTFNNSAFLESKNPISIAAIYNYLGEIRNAELRFDEAMEFYDLAINLCEGIEATCVAVFYINAARTCFLIGDYDSMDEYLRLADRIIKQFDSYWQTPVLDALISLKLYFEGNYYKSIEYLKMAKTESKIINNPNDEGMISFVETVLAYEISVNSNPEHERLGEYIKESPEIYYYNAIRYLDHFRYKAEIEYLKKKILEDKE